METTKKKILIVDDDVDALHQTTIMVRQMGFDVIEANGMKEAEKIIEHTKPDLAIIDLMMEQKDSGFVLSQKLKKTFPDVPVIILTALTAETGMIFSLEESDDRKWIKADVYLEKGVRADQLEREIKRLLKM